MRASAPGSHGPLSVLGAGISTDGSKLLFVRAPTRESLSGWELYSYDLATQNAARLPFPSRPMLPPALPGFHFEGAEVLFAPDTKKMLLETEYSDVREGRSNRKEKLYCEVFVSSLDGRSVHSIRRGGVGGKVGASKTVLDVYGATWSPDGKHIALQEIITNRKHRPLFMYDADGGNGRCIYTEKK